MREKMMHIFENIFGSRQNSRLFFAPGRVNLIGEYTDFNGGHVLPCALTIGTYAVVRPREDKKCCFYSENFPDLGIIEALTSAIAYKREDDWANYPKGVVSIFQEEGIAIETGFDIAFYGNIPNGAGLSSSASIEMLMAVVLKALYDVEFSMEKMVALAQKTENEYIGVNCGIMDQFAIGMGKKEHGVLLNTSTMAYRYAHLEFGDYALVISNTNKRRGLEDSKYNERRVECEQAVKDLNMVISIRHLCDIDVETFELYKHAIKSPIHLRRARHVISENQRTIEAHDQLNNGNIKRFGALMNASHASLKEDFEVTGLELDTLVTLSQKFEGVIGARMTGAGFGGCTVSLMHKEKVTDFIGEINAAYKEIIGHDADFYVVEAGNGACELVE